AGRIVTEKIQRQKIIEKMTVKGSTPELKKLTVDSASKTSMKRTLQVSYSRMWFEGKVSASDELRKGGFDREAQMQAEDIQAEWLSRAWIKDWLKDHNTDLTRGDVAALRKAADQSFEVTGVIDEAILSSAKQILYTQAGVLTSREIIANLEKAFTNLSEARVRTIVNTNTARYFNDGRMTEYEAAGDFVIGYLYAAVLDSVTTPFCRVHDGQRIGKTNPWFGRGFPPAHFNCRSQWIAIFRGEGDFVETWTNTPTPMVGFGG
ncbi:MAG: minor capsid protein, partial [Planctomycetota bacterium]